jgi:hypothetical protein
MAIDPRININENQVIFRRDGGHKHDGLTSSLIDYTRYSVFDFLPYPIAPPGSPRRRFQDANEISFKSFIVSAIEERVLNPQGIRVQANSITAREIHSNTITAREISANTITANELNSNLILVNNIIRSTNFNGSFHANGVINSSGTIGWGISYAGSSVFNNATIRGRLTAGDIYIPSVESAQFSVTSAGVMSATGATIDGIISAGGVELGRDVGPSTGHFGLSLSSENFDNIFLKRGSDGVVFFRLNSGGTNSLTFDSASGVLAVKGQVSASSGTIGGWTVGATSFTSTSVTLDASGNRITVGPVSGNSAIRLDSDNGIWLGNTTFSSAPFRVTMAGALTCTSGTIGGFTVGTGSITRTGTGGGTRFQVGDECVFTANSVTAGLLKGAVEASTNAGSASTPVHQTVTGAALYRSTSRREYKFDIEDLDSQDRNLIDKLRPRKFKWNWLSESEESEESKYLRSQDIHFGFVAEEMADIDTEGRVGSFGVYEPYQDSYKPIFWRTYDLISLLVSEVQDLRKRVSELES